MAAYLARRLVYMVVVLALVSVTSFYVINLPPGSWVETYAIQLDSSGTPASAAQLAYITERYGLDRPLYEQYLRWIVPIITEGDFGFSFEWQQPVSALVGDRLLLTIVVSLASLVFVYAISIPVALHSATHQYSVSDYFFSFLGIIGLATPSFLLALVLLVMSARAFGVTPTGLFSPEYLTAPWSLDKWLDLMIHLPVPVIVVGLAGTAATIRILRSQLLDEFNKQYVTTARSKGLGEWRLILKYPFRVAIEPDRLDHLHASAVDRLRLDDRRDRAWPADDRAAPLACDRRPGHLCRRILPDALRHVDGRRRVPVRHAFDVARPAPAHGARRMSATVAIDTPRTAPRILSQRTLVWLRFRRHKVALFSLWFLAALYVIVLFAEFFAPYDPFGRTPTAILLPRLRCISSATTGRPSAHLSTVASRNSIGRHFSAAMSRIAASAFRSGCSCAAILIVSSVSSRPTCTSSASTDPGQSSLWARTALVAIF